jgi:hypothetical protein
MVWPIFYNVEASDVRNREGKLDQNKRRKNQTLSEDEKRVPRGNKLSMPAPATTVFLSLFDVNFNNKPL